MSGQIILNTSPLILLLKGELDFILPELFQSIYVPQGVYNEIMAYPEDKSAKKLIQKHDFQYCHCDLLPQIIAWDLGKGETEVISFALANQEVRPVLDDARAKACCLAFGLKPLGTGSILVLAKEKGIISSVRGALSKLKIEGMWISDQVVELLCHKAGEWQPNSKKI